MSTILIVEDEEGIAAFIAKGLKAAGFTTHATASGVDGVAHAVHGNFDLVVLDVGLPDIDGFEVLERVRGQGVRVPVIMLTARSSVTDRVAGLESGADDYMAKPFSFEELLARIRQRLRRASAADSGSSSLSHNGLVLDFRTGDGRRSGGGGRERRSLCRGGRGGARGGRCGAGGRAGRRVLRRRLGGAGAGLHRDGGLGSVVGPVIGRRGQPSAEYRQHAEHADADPRGAVPQDSHAAQSTEPR